MVRPVCEYCQRKIGRQTEAIRRHYRCRLIDACEACATQYLGRYDLENPALAGVVKFREQGRRLRWKAARTYDQKEAAARLQAAYATHVRSLSRAHLQRHPNLLNPNGYRIGRSGTFGSYQLDHIVPVIMCWEHYVPPADAASMRNLQVVPWSMNVARRGDVLIENMVGYPDPSPAEPDMSVAVDTSVRVARSDFNDDKLDQLVDAAEGRPSR